MAAYQPLVTPRAARVDPVRPADRETRLFLPPTPDGRALHVLFTDSTPSLHPCSETRYAGAQ